VSSVDSSFFGPFGGKLSSLGRLPGYFRLVDAAASLLCRFGSKERTVLLWPDARFRVNLLDRIQRQMWCGGYEPHITRCIKAILGQGDVFVDIGANIGYHSFFAAGVVGKNGKVFSFEPDSEIYKCLETNLQEFPQAHALNCAVWDREGELTFERSSQAQESGWGTLTAVRNLGAGEQVTVRATSLDGWKRESDTAVVRAIKLDAEGSELGVLRGAKRVLSECRPCLMLEVNDVLLRQAKTSGDEVLNELRKHSYQIYEIAAAKLLRIPASIDFSFADCICLPEESAGELLRLLERHGFRR
jgi:FkbM family methyltransferase